MASTFSVDDIRLLEKTISIRERIIDNLLVKQELPTKARDIEALNTVLESVDRSIFTKVKINIEESSARVNEETKEVLRDLLLNLHKNTNTPGATSEPHNPTYVPQDIRVNDGELISKLDQQDVESLLQSQVQL